MIFLLIVCKICNSKIPDGAKNCTICGYSIDFDESLLKPAAEEPAVETADEDSGNSATIKGSKNPGGESKSSLDDIFNNSIKDSTKIPDKSSPTPASSQSAKPPQKTQTVRVKKKRKKPFVVLLLLLVVGFAVYGLYAGDYLDFDKPSKETVVLKEYNILDLTPVETSNGSEAAFEIYETCKDNQAHVIENAFGGVDKNGENIQYYTNDGYKYFRGLVFLNSPYTRVEDSSTYFRLYGDGELIYTSPLVQMGMKPTIVCVDISQYDVVGVSVYGKNMVRATDCYLTNRNSDDIMSYMSETYDYAVQN